MPTESLYDRTADIYDVRHDSPTTERVRTLEKRIIRKYAEGLTLDVGCGTGYHLDLVEHIVGLDPSREMLEKARTKGKTVILGKGESLPFPDRHFDTVLCMFSVLNVCDAERVVKEIRRVLKPGGTAIVSVTSVWDHTHMPFWKKRETNAGEFRVKKFRVGGEKAKMKLFTKQDFLGLFGGFRVLEFDSLFCLVKPRWCSFRRFSIWERILLGTERMLPVKDYGCMYFGVFRRN